MSRQYVNGGPSYVEGNTLYGENGENLGYVSDGDKLWESGLADRVNEYHKNKEAQNNYQRETNSNSNTQFQQESSNSDSYNYNYGPVNDYYESATNYSASNTTIDPNTHYKVKDRKRSSSSYTIFKFILSIVVIISLYIVENIEKINIMPEPSINIEVLFVYACITALVMVVIDFLRWVFRKSSKKKSFIYLFISSYILSVLSTFFLFDLFLSIQESGIIIPYLSEFFYKFKYIMIELLNNPNLDTVIKFLLSFTPGWALFFTIKTIKQRGFY